MTQFEQCCIYFAYYLFHDTSLFITEIPIIFPCEVLQPDPELLHFLHLQLHTVLSSSLLRLILISHFPYHILTLNPSSSAEFETQIPTAPLFQRVSSNLPHPCFSLFLSKLSFKATSLLSSPPTLLSPGKSIFFTTFHVYSLLRATQFAWNKLKHLSNSLPLLLHLWNKNFTITRNTSHSGQQECLKLQVSLVLPITHYCYLGKYLWLMWS